VAAPGPAPAPSPGPALAPATPFVAGGGRLRASPLAKKLAQRAGLDLAAVRGTGPGGRIIQRDIEGALAARGAAPAATAVPAPSPAVSAPVGRPAVSAPAAPTIVRYALDLTRRSRPAEPDAPEVVRRMVSWGAGPRAVQFLILGAKARAALHGHPSVSIEDIQAVSLPVMRHRVITNFAAQAEGYAPDRLVSELIASTPAHRAERIEDERLARVINA